MRVEAAETFSSGIDQQIKGSEENSPRALSIRFELFRADLDLRLAVMRIKASKFDDPILLF